MDAKLKADWVAALRSGEYQQGRGWLCQIDQEDGSKSYCCLGVLADIEKISYTEDGNPGKRYYDFSSFSSEDFDGERVGWGTREAASVPASFIGLPEGDTSTVSTLVQMNDSSDVGFSGIADWIEKNL